MNITLNNSDTTINGSMRHAESFWSDNSSLAVVVNTTNATTNGNMDDVGRLWSGTWYLEADIPNLIVLSLIAVLGLGNLGVILCFIQVKALRKPFNYIVLGKYQYMS